MHGIDEPGGKKPIFVAHLGKDAIFSYHMSLNNFSQIKSWSLIFKYKIHPADTSLREDLSNYIAFDPS
jgi:hypothetical protein